MSGYTSKATKSFALGALCLGLPIQVYAAQAIEEIVVSATKRDTILQDTSESIQVLSSTMITDIGIDDFSEYFRLVPNLSQADNFGPGFKRYAIRGINSAGEPLVGVYYDDVPGLGSPGQAQDSGGSQPDLKLWDIERIEILKGPQGTLYGSGAMGGAIRVISSKPNTESFDLAMEGSAQSVRYGDMGYIYKGMVNIPLIENKLALRLTGYNYDMGGYIDNELIFIDDNVNEEETSGGRLGVRWTPTDRLTVDFTSYLQNLETDHTFQIFERNTDDAPKSAAVAREPFRDDVKILNTTIQYSLDQFDVLYSFAYQDREIERVNDTTRFVIFGLAGLPEFLCPDSAIADGSCLAMINGGPFGEVVPAASWARENNKQRSHELRLTSNGEGDWQWTLGLYYESRDTRRIGQVAVSPNDGKIVFGPQGVAEKLIFARNNWGTREQTALYGELTRRFADNWAITAGVRWFDTEREERQVAIKQVNPSDPTGLLPVEDFEDDGVIGKLKLEWDVTEEALAYFMVAQGFRVGGPNQPVGFNTTAPPFDSDELINYELGFKTSLLDRRVYLDGAIYYIDWSDVQFLTTDATGAFTLIGNAGDATVEGVELNVNALLGERMTLGFGFGYSKARFDGDQPTQGLLLNQTRDGDRVPGTPDLTASLNLDYTIPFSQFDLTLGGDWTYRGSKVTGLRKEAGNFRKMDDYDQLNIRVGLEFHEHWSAWLRVENVTDELPEISGRYIRNEPFRFATLQPRTVSLTVNYDY